MTFWIALLAGAFAIYAWAAKEIFEMNTSHIFVQDAREPQKCLLCGKPVSEHGQKASQFTDLNKPAKTGEMKKG